MRALNSSWQQTSYNVAKRCKRTFIKQLVLGHPWWLSGKESTCQSRRQGLDPWSQKIPHAVEQLSPCVHDYWAHVPWSPCSATTEATAMRCPCTAPERVSGVAQSCPTLCDPMDSTRLLCPWDSLSKNTGVGYHFLLQGIFPTHGSNLGLPHWRQML